MVTNRYKFDETFIGSSWNRIDRGYTSRSHPESRLWLVQRNYTLVDKPAVLELDENIISPSTPSTHTQLATLIFYGIDKHLGGQDLATGPSPLGFQNNLLQRTIQPYKQQQ